MEKLKAKYQQIIKAYQTLELIIKEITHEEEKTKPNEKLLAIYRDSIVKRFEFSYELTWKYLKAYLEATYGIILNSPKKVIRGCFEQNIITEQEAKELLNMVDDRNLITHTYSEFIAQQISEHIVNYYEVMKIVIDKLKV